MKELWLRFENLRRLEQSDRNLAYTLTKSFTRIECIRLGLLLYDFKDTIRGHLTPGPFEHVWLYSVENRFLISMINDSYSIITVNLNYEKWKNYYRDLTT